MKIKKTYLSLAFLIIPLYESKHVLGAEFDGNQSAWGLHLPDPVTSFGACKEGRFLYVYGGHVGDAHVYSRKTHSKTYPFQYLIIVHIISVLRINLYIERTLSFDLNFHDHL